MKERFHIGIGSEGTAQREKSVSFTMTRRQHLKSIYPQLQILGITNPNRSLHLIEGKPNVPAVEDSFFLEELMMKELQQA